MGKDKQWIEGPTPFVIPRIGEHVNTLSGRKRVKDVIHSLTKDAPGENGEAVSDDRLFQTEVILEDQSQAE